MRILSFSVNGIVFALEISQQITEITANRHELLNKFCDSSNSVAI